jgi:hypothetical protein
VTARLNLFRQAVVTSVRTALPQLRHCESQFGRFDLDELATSSLPSPAVRVAILKARARPQPSGEQEARLSCAAFIVVDGRDRDERAWTIAEAIAVLLHSGQMFGLLQLGVPDEVEIQPLLAMNLRQRGVSIIAVEWKQDLRRLGDGIFDAAGHVVTGLYVGDEEIEAGDGP